jgi:hypothetical protein
MAKINVPFGSDHQVPAAGARSGERAYFDFL